MLKINNETLVINNYNLINTYNLLHKLNIKKDLDCVTLVSNLLNEELVMKINKVNEILFSDDISKHKLNDNLLKEFISNILKLNNIKSFVIGFEISSKITQRLKCFNLLFKSINTYLPNLIMLNLSSSNLNDDRCLYISNVIDNCKFIENLNLNENSITHYGIKNMYYAVLHSKNIKHLSLNWNCLSDNGLTLLTNIYKDKIKLYKKSSNTNYSIKALEYLNLCYNLISYKGVKDLSELLRCSNDFKYVINLKVLNLGGNNISYIGYKYLIAGLIGNKYSIERISIFHNNIIANRGFISYFKKIFINTIYLQKNIKDLELFGNYISNENLKKLFKELKLIDFNNSKSSNIKIKIYGSNYKIKKMFNLLNQITVL